MFETSVVDLAACSNVLNLQDCEVKNATQMGWAREHREPRDPKWDCTKIKSIPPRVRQPDASSDNFRSAAHRDESMNLYGDALSKTASIRFGPRKWTGRSLGDDGLSNDSVDVIDWLYEKLAVKIRSSIGEDDSEAMEYGEPTADERALQACLTLASYISGLLSELSPGFAWAPFLLDDGGVSLILRSKKTHRRVEFKFPPCGAPITVVRIDEHLAGKQFPINIAHRDRIGRIAKWVHCQVSALAGC